MDLTQIKEEYGSQCVNELLDIALITKGKDMYDGGWRMLALRYGIVKQTTKTVRGNHYYNSYSNTHRIWMLNGRGIMVFNLEFNTQQLEAYRKGE